MTKLKKRKLKSLFIRNEGLSEEYKPEGTRLVYKENEVMENITLSRIISLNFSFLSLLEENKRRRQKKIS